MAGSEILPAVPAPGSPVSAEEVAELERRVATNVEAVKSVDQADEWRSQAAALEAYLRGRAFRRRCSGRRGGLRDGLGSYSAPLDATTTVVRALLRS